MASSSSSRRAAARLNQAQRTGSGINPAAVLHPMFQKKLVEVAQDEEARLKAAGWMPIWDDLNNMYVECAKGVMAPAILSSLSARRDIIAHIRDKHALKLRIDMFKRDIQTLKTELSAIYAEHSNKSGGSYEPDDIMLSVQISEKYNLFRERLEATISPTVAHIFEIFTEAEVLMLAEQGKLSDKGTQPDPAAVASAAEVSSAAAEAVSAINTQQ